MPNTYRIQVQTKDYVPELGHDYSDAQYLVVPMDMTLDQVEKTYGPQIEAEKAKRIANWIDAVKNPPVQAEPTEEDLVKEEASLDEQIAQLQAKKVEVADAIMTVRAYKEVEPVVDKEELKK